MLKSLCLPRHLPVYRALAANALLGTCIMWQANTWHGRLIFQRGREEASQAYISCIYNMLCLCVNSINTLYIYVCILYIYVYLYILYKYTHPIYIFGWWFSTRLFMFNHTVFRMMIPTCG